MFTVVGDTLITLNCFDNKIFVKSMRGSRKVCQRGFNSDVWPDAGFVAL